MDKEFLHFEKINRETWQNLHRKTTPPLSQTELNSIKSFNDRINLQDVTRRLPAFDKPDWNLQAFQRRFGLLKRYFPSKNE